jgi:hypothetical protein
MGWDIGNPIDTIKKQYGSIKDVATGNANGEDWLNSIAPYYDAPMKLFGGGGGNQEDPSAAAMKYLQDAVAQGKDAYNFLNPMYREMASDPTGYMNKLISAYAPSEQYKQAREEAMRAAGAGAAAGGVAGTPQDLKYRGKIVDALMSQDMQQWLNNAMNMKGAGMQGMSHFYDIYPGALSSQASLAFQGAANRNQAAADQASNMWRTLGTVGGGLVGAYFGGPAGAAVGSNVGSQFGGQMGNYGGGNAGNYSLNLYGGDY